MTEKEKPTGGLKNGLTVGVRDCQYIFGDVGLPEHTLFCGKPAKPGSPYCEEHHRACYDGKGKVYAAFQGYPRKRG